MTKKELRCKHRHTQAEHPQCFMNGKLIDEAQWWKQLRTGYLDIETSQFDAVYGYMISWALYDPRLGTTYSDCINLKDIQSGDFDKRLVKSLLNCMSNYDCVVTYYGTGFDIPYIRTRAFYHKLPFFTMGTIKHIDLYYLVRGKLKLRRNGLDSATALFGIKGKNHVDPRIWVSASAGNKKALSYVIDHNLQDVWVLEELHRKLETQGRFTKRSI